MNRKKILNSLNPLLIVAFAGFLIVCKTTLKSFAPSILDNFNFFIPFLIFFGQRRSLPEGIILTLFLSHIYSLNSAAPIGVFTTEFLALYILSRLLSLAVFAQEWYSTLILLFTLSLLDRLLLGIVAAFFGHGGSEFFSAWVWICHLFWNTFFGVFIFKILLWMDIKTYKAPQIMIELSEGRS